MNVYLKIIFLSVLSITSMFVIAETESAQQDCQQEELGTFININVTCNPEQKIEHVEQNIYVRQSETPDCSVEIKKQISEKSDKPSFLSRATHALGFIVICATTLLLVPPSHEKPYIFGTHVPMGPYPY